VFLEVGASLAASDLDRARRWYEEKLGLTPYEVWPEPGLLLYRVGTSHFSIYLTPSAGTAKNTVAGIMVSDLRAEVARLRARGVVFEDYDLDAIKTVDGVAEDERDGSTNAWFTDSEGNVLVLAQDGPPKA